MTDFFTILTQKAKGCAHAETKITIDWTGITQDELMTLARRALVYQFQIGVQRGLIEGVPEAAHFVAREHARDRTPIIEVVFAPKIVKPAVRHKPTLEELLAELPPEELAILLAEVKNV